MKTCFKLALFGEGDTSPNPLVGAILVNSKGEIVAKGYHKCYGSDHAEVDCIKSYETAFGKSADYSSLTLFVNLEPCNHFGKTPPCADLIIKKGIKKVVIGALDPYPNHSGGIKKLKDAGVEVIYGILEDEAIILNEAFFKAAKDNFPFIAIKTATTLDGKIATHTGSSKWITSEKSRKYVQKLRHKYDGILTSSSTVIKDDPSLNVRFNEIKVSKYSLKTQPTRIILDTCLKTDPNSKVYKTDDNKKVFIFYSDTDKTKHQPDDYPKNINLIKVDSKNGHVNLKEVFKKLYDSGIQSILIEAGGTLCGAILKEDLADKIYHFIAPKILGDKTAINFAEGFNIKEINDCRNFKITTVKKLEPDILIEYYKK